MVLRRILVVTQTDVDVSLRARDGGQKNFTAPLRPSSRVPRYLALPPFRLVLLTPRPALPFLFSILRFSAARARVQRMLRGAALKHHGSAPSTAQQRLIYARD